MILLAAWCRENRPELTRLFELVQEYRRWGKIKGTYLDGYLRHINSATGRIHPDLMPLGTETGRFAARNPNLQNMPRKGSDPIGIRNMLVAPEGYQVMELDTHRLSCAWERFIAGTRVCWKPTGAAGIFMHRLPLLFTISP